MLVLQVPHLDAFNVFVRILFIHHSVISDLIISILFTQVVGRRFPCNFWKLQVTERGIWGCVSWCSSWRNSRKRIVHLPSNWFICCPPPHSNTNNNSNILRVDFTFEETTAEYLLHSIFFQYSLQTQIFFSVSLLNQYWDSSLIFRPRLLDQHIKKSRKRSLLNSQKSMSLPTSREYFVAICLSLLCSCSLLSLHLWCHILP